MKNKTISGFLIVCASAVLWGCGAKDAVHGVSQRIEDPDVMKTWESKCEANVLVNLSSKTFIQFSGRDVYQAHELYSDAACTTPVARVRYAGNFDLKDKNADNSRQVDLNFQAANVVALTDAGKTALNAVRFCGRAWELNQPGDVTLQARGVNCPLKNLPRIEFNVYKVDGRFINFGQIGLRNQNDDLARRPTTPDRNLQFQEINRSLN